MWHYISNYQINKEGVILGHVGYGPIGMILVWPSALFLEDSEPTACSSALCLVFVGILSSTSLPKNDLKRPGEISNFPSQIWILLRKLVQVQVEHFPLQQIIYFQFQPLPLKQPYRVIWWEFQISLFRSGFSLKNKSMY